MPRSLLLLLPLVITASLVRAGTSNTGRDSSSLASGQGKAAGGAFPATRAAEYADPRIDVVHYALDLRLHTTPPLLTGRVTVTARSLVDTLADMLLDLSAPMTVDSAFSPPAGAEAEVVRFPAGISVRLDRQYARGEEVRCTIFYHGVPQPTGFGSFIMSSSNGWPWVWSLSQPYGARDWWPCKDHPLDKADSVDLMITCPSGLRVGSNGLLRSVTDNGDGTETHHWAERYPVATYLVSIAVGNFAAFSDWYRFGPTDSMEILNYVLPEHLEGARAELGRTPAMLGVFREIFGEYPFIAEKYGHAEFGAGGAMEHQTMTSTTTFAENTIAHELAHQWFGDLITCARWSDLWMNEGFATYAEALYRERMYGVEEYRAHIALRMSSALDSPGTLVLEDTSSVSTMFLFSRVYAKGASVLHMLRHVLGDSTFFRVLRSYTGDPLFRFGTVTTDQFRDLCEEVSGRSLETFFRQWVYGEGYPRYAFDWATASAAQGYETSLRIVQSTPSANPSLFVMPLDIRLSGSGWDTTVVVFNDITDQEFLIPTTGRPERVEIDPDGWVLKEVSPAGGGLPVAYAVSQNFPNPFNSGTSILVRAPRRGPATLAVYDRLGREIRLVLDGVLEAGEHTVRWEGDDTNGRTVASGVYLYRLRAGGTSHTGTMLLLR